MRHGYVLSITASLLFAGCGGGGSGGSAGQPLTPNSTAGGASVSYTPGVYQPWRGLAARCATPRTGLSPSGAPWPDQSGSVAAENNFLRSWIDDTYLWYSEVQDRDPRNYSDPTAYFDLLRTDATTSSGKDKDQFHFWLDTEEYIQLSQSGVETSYGAQWILTSSTAPRQVLIAYVEQGSPAALANLTRGDEVLLVDGVDARNGATQSQVDVLNAGLFPDTPGETHTLRLSRSGAGAFDVTLTSAEVTYQPVPLTSVIDDPQGDIGYLLFNDHVATAEDALRSAIAQLQSQNISDLVLDVRYNGGGYLDIASELAYMIGGSQTSGRVFERLRFNDKHPSTNPITGQPLTPTPFHTTTQGFGATEGAPLPTLDLQRVYVLTGPNTCSASESIINGLRGAGVEVYQIGSTTCGKPYGFYAQENCGITYFAIQFQGVNEQNFGEYADGFAPSNGSGAGVVSVPGCSVADDLASALGDPNEMRLATAIDFRNSGNSPAACPAATGWTPDAQLKPGAELTQTDGVMVKSPLRTNRLLL